VLLLDVSLSSSSLSAVCALWLSSSSSLDEDDELDGWVDVLEGAVVFHVLELAPLVRCVLRSSLSSSSLSSAEDEELVDCGEVVFHVLELAPLLLVPELELEPEPDERRASGLGLSSS